MAVGERERRHLQEALVRTIGPESTDALLAYLPPIGWADVATKADLAANAEIMEHRMHSEIAELEIGLSDRLRTQSYWLASLQMLILTVMVTAMVGLKIF